MSDNYTANSGPHGDYRAQAAQHFGGSATVSEHANVTLLPSEEVLFAGDFTASPILRHIKTGLVVTRDRVIVRHPQYIFLFIKVGYAESSAPIRHICAVTTGRMLARNRVMSALISGFFGLFLLMSGFASFGGVIGALAVLVALMCLAFAALQAWLARSLGLTVGYTGGGALHVDVEKLEFHEMVTAGTVIQQLVLGSGGSSATIEKPAQAPVNVYRAPEPAARPAPQRAAPVPPTAAAPPQHPSAPPSIFRS